MTRGLKRRYRPGRSCPRVAAPDLSVWLANGKIAVARFLLALKNLDF